MILNFTRALAGVALMAFSFSATAQCEPDGFDFGEAGFGLVPDGIETFFATGDEGMDYEQIMYLLVPTDASQIDPDLPSLQIDSIELVAVNLLTFAELDTVSLDVAGLSIACNNSGLCADDCTFLAGSQGCASLFGVPDTAGQFFISIDLLVWSTIFGSPFSTEQAFSGLELTINSGVDNVAEQGFDFDGLGQIFPVPAQDVLNVELNVLCDLTVTDGLGRLVATHSRATGRQTFDVSTWPAGMYIIRAQDQGRVATRRVTVQH